MAQPTVLRNAKLRKLRALRMIEARIGGIPLKQIGDMLGLARNTVEKELAWAERQGLMDDLEKQILAEVAPLAIKAIKVALNADNHEVALEVMKGTGLFKKPAERIAASQPASPNDESLEVHVRRISRAAPQITPGREAGPQLGGVSEAPALGPAPIEAELVADSGEAREAHADKTVGLDSYVGQVLQRPLAP